MFAGWPGSVHDARIWNNSPLNDSLPTLLANVEPRRLYTGEDQEGRSQHEYLPAYILSDVGYPNSGHIVTTLNMQEVRSSREAQEVNKILSAMRYGIECSFGLIKGWSLEGYHCFC